MSPVFVNNYRARDHVNRNNRNKKGVSDLEEVVLVDVCGEAGERLPARAAEPHEQRVRARLCQHAADTGHVLDGEPASTILLA